MNPAGLTFLDLALEVIIKSLVVLVAALTLTWFMRRSSSSVRHLLLSAAAVSLLALPLASVLMPPLSIVTAPSPFGDPSVVRYETAPLVETGSTHRFPAVESPGNATTHRDRWLTRFLVVWGAGASFLLLRLVGGIIYGYRIVTGAPAVKDERLLDAVRRISERFGISRPVPVVESDHLKVPFVWGFFKQRLILPPTAREWSLARIEAVLRHELAHIKRKDTFVQALAQIACCIYWVNPLTWIMERWLFIERERACDDVAISQDIQAAEYAGYLMEVAEEMGDTRSRLWVASALAEGTDFKDRILSILDPVAKRTVPKLRQTATVITCAALLVLPLSSLHASGGASAATTRPRTSGSSGEPAKVVDVHAEQGTGSSSQPAELIALLDSPDAAMREEAATALGEAGNTEAVAALIEALDDSDSSVREHAASALGWIGDREAIPHLARVLLSDPDAGVREHAASATGRIGKDDDAYRTLVEVYESDRSIGVRAHAAHGLGLMREERAFDLLVDGLGSKYPEIRLHCAEALGMVGDHRAVPHLEHASRDRDDRVRESAGRALKSIREKQ
jgi:beta-lactamase regulating signal transducer with metallopeptidase domain